MKPLRILLGLVTVGSIATVMNWNVAVAASMDCSQAQAMMLKARSMVQSAPTMTGNVDKDFAAMEIGSAKAQMMMAHVEMSCGKNAAEKQNAEKLLKESQDRLLMLQTSLRPELR